MFLYKYQKYPLHFCPLSLALDSILFLVSVGKEYMNDKRNSPERWRTQSIDSSSNLLSSIVGLYLWDTDHGIDQSLAPSKP